MQITKTQRNFLRKLANPLKPTVQIGKQGLTEQIIEKVGRELDVHELIKVRLLEFKDQKQQLAQTLVDETDAALVGVIGNVITLFRPSPIPERQLIALPGGDDEES